MGKTGIAWTDETWNPVTGCTKVSAGCKHCYAEGVADRFWATQYPPIVVKHKALTAPLFRPRRFTDVQCHPDRLEQPLRWRKPRRVFVNSMSDLFHEDVPGEFIDRVFITMGMSPRHTFQVLTKRPHRMYQFMSELQDKWAKTTRNGQRVVGFGNAGMGVKESLVPWPLSNVWLGVSVENQPTADERVPLLLQTPAAVRFVSAEPLLGSIRFGVSLHGNWIGPEKWEWGSLDWVIVGGESGPDARPCDIEWVRSIKDQCAKAKVACFVKQLGSHVVLEPMEFPPAVVRNSAALPRVKTKHRKGGDPEEWPEDLRVREFPAVGGPS